MCTVGGTGLAALRMATWIPVLAAAVASFKAVNEYQALEQVLPITHTATQYVCSTLSVPSQ